MNLMRGARMVRGARRWLLVAVVLVAGVVVLGLWMTPPSWLIEPGKVTLSGLRWAREHLLAAGVVLGIAGLVLPLLLRRLERREAADEQRRARDREVMLKRVRRRWIEGVLEQSLTKEVRIRLGLARRLDTIRQPDRVIRRRYQKNEILPSGISISEVFDQADGGMLILGAPGSGKTMALLELARDLLDHAIVDQAQPMPVVFNLSSWAVQRLPLVEWLVDELHKSYDVPRSIARRWVAAGEVLPLLDGLDEVAKAHDAGCVEAINAFQREHGLVRFVVCSRTADYTALVIQLRVAEAVELQPLTDQQVYDYLKAAGAALAEVQAALEADRILWKFLQSPLILSIVALTYQGRSADELREPDLPAQRLTRLFKAYTERMFEHRPNAARYSPTQMRHWLSWLARSMHARSQSEFHLDRLQPDWLPTSAQRRLAILIPATGVGLTLGLAYGLAYGLPIALACGLVLRLSSGLLRAVIVGLVGGLGFGLVYGLRLGPTYGLASGLVFGLAFGVVGRLVNHEPVEQVHRSWRRLIVGLVGGLLVGLLLGLGFAPVGGLGFGLVNGLGLGLLFGLLFGLVRGLTDERSTPNEGIHRSARHGSVFGLLAGLTMGFTFGLAYRPSFGLAYGLIFWAGIRAAVRWSSLSAAPCFAGLTFLQRLRAVALRSFP
jgi:hypothetical protein